MCGICGLVERSGGPVNAGLLHRMAAPLRHRGPDDEGTVTSGRVGLAARRLSIIDVDGGHQPISNEDDTVWCVLNGEIYNYRELMADLRQRGHSFRTHCDTEVLAHLYEEYGVDFLDRLHGMFGLAVWDLRRDVLILARDHLGIKPLYYADVGNRLLFGSELTALLPAGLPRDIDPDALDAYFALSYIPAPYTIYKAARKLLPGHCLICKGGGRAEVAPYWELPAPSTPRKGVQDVTDVAEELRSLLRLAVGRHMISDVPLGAFLSGGLDSSTVVALMAEQSEQPVRTFSIGFRERSYDESPHARSVAQAFGTRHKELVLEPDPVALTQRLAHMYDEPFADSSALATYSVAHLARQDVKVALTGDGGDEAFGGYAVYQADKLANLYRRLPSVLRDGVVPAVAAALPSSDRKTSFDYKARHFTRAAALPPADAHLGWKTIFEGSVRHRLLSAWGPQDVAGDLMRGYYRTGSNRDNTARALYADMRLGLPDDMLTKVDRATMAVSLEARVPLLDRSVVEYMAQLPSSLKVHRWQLKYLLKRSVSGLVPEDIVTRRKAGFNIPVARWLRGELRDVVLEVLSPRRVQAMAVLDPAVVQRIVDDHLSGRSDRGRETWALLMFALWHKAYMESRPASVAEITSSVASM